MGGLSICGPVTGACYRPVLNVTFGSLDFYASLLLPLQAAALSTKRGSVRLSSVDDTVRTISSVEIAISSQVVVPDWRGSLTLSELMGGCYIWVAGTLMGRAPIPLFLGLIK